MRDETLYKIIRSLRAAAWVKEEVPKKELHEMIGKKRLLSLVGTALVGSGYHHNPSLFAFVAPTVTTHCLFLTLLLIINY